MLAGNLGRAVIKTSAVAPEHRLIEAPARVFGDQSEFQAAFEAGELDDDLVAVVRYQGPKANGMPELHKLTRRLGVLQDRGHRVALVTDGRMSGASGKIPRPSTSRRGRRATRAPSPGCATATGSGSTPTRDESRCSSTRRKSPPRPAAAPPDRESSVPAGSCRVLPQRRRPGRRGRGHLWRGRVSGLASASSSAACAWMSLPVIPVVVLEDANQAVPLAHALAGGGLPIVGARLAHAVRAGSGRSRGARHALVTGRDPIIRRPRKTLTHTAPDLPEVQVSGPPPAL